MKFKPDNFWYAVNTTEIVMMPKTYLDTFGTTSTHYFMVSPLMDTVNEIRVREGSIKSEKPTVITPTYFENEVLEGFGSEATQYVQWLKNNSRYLHILQYGIKVQKTDISEHVVHGTSEEVLEKVKAEAQRRDDSHTAVVYGVDDYWEISLIKLMRDVIMNSAPSNAFELHQKKLFDDVGGVPRAVREEIEKFFMTATKDPSLIPQLNTMLQKHNLFEEYEDRFFALVRYTSSSS